MQVCRDHGVDRRVHFAAYKNVGESMVHHSATSSNNVDGTVRLFDGRGRSRRRRLVFSSSCSVYGTPDVVPVDEDQPIAPESVYAETKAMVERVLHWYDRTRELRSVSLRYFNAAGASFDARIGEDWTYALNLMPVAIRALLTGDTELQVFGDDYPTPDGTCIRDYIHVDDLADAHLAALDYLAAGGRTDSVQRRHRRRLVGARGARRHRTHRRTSGAAPDRRAPCRRSGVDVCRPDPITDVLGWSAEHGLDEILETAYRWHCAQLERTSG